MPPGQIWDQIKRGNKLKKGIGEMIVVGNLIEINAKMQNVTTTTDVLTVGVGTTAFTIVGKD